ncbi:hypothetical protein BJY04DRAFT_214751 [Aspergillus karnatakaensis]|uniref:uncharacterized protein n=1 Tax=Aspergillus karnatakaensis TaxID=1810916 RepID=UPI003CCDEFF0
MSELPRQFAHDDYSIGWICALADPELLAAAAMLDEEHPILPAASQQDTNSYLLGRIGSHNVAIACLPAETTGTVSAASVANNMLHSFPSIRFGLMVGIGGGAPQYGPPRQEATSDYEEESDSDDGDEGEVKDIRLGDVVVSLHSKTSEAVVQYDFGKAIQSKEFVHAGGKLNKPPALILSALTRLRFEHDRKGNRIPQLVDEAIHRNPGMSKRFKYPGPEKDKLFKAETVHVEGRKTCKACLGESQQNLIIREERDSLNPVVHYGTIGSGNTVMRDAILRDKWAKEASIICFEMEAAGKCALPCFEAVVDDIPGGLMDQFPCLVIRGICDYADSHKNKAWQPYAAITSAAHAKELLLLVPEQGIKGLPPVKQVLNKLSNIEDSIKEVKETILSAEERHYREGVLSWLSRLDYTSKQNDMISRRQPGTASWFLESDRFQHWIDTQKSTLYCPGIPGAGKTIIAASVIDHLQRTVCHSEGGLAYIYCTYNERYTARDLLESLLRQLCLQLSTLPTRVDEMYLAHRMHKTAPNVKELLVALKSIYSSFPRIFVVVDALDECQDEKNRNNLIDVLKQLKRDVSLLVTCRPIGTIEESFTEDDWLRITAFGEDIRTYVASEVQRHDFVLASSLNTDEELRLRIVDEVVEKAQGMFLHAQFHVNFLATKHNVRDLKEGLENLPTTSGAIYEQAMERIRGQNSDTLALALRTLCWIVGAVKPLSIVQVQHALAVREGDTDIHPDGLTSPSYLLSICAGLITVDQETSIMRLVHYTAKEYFERNNRTYLPQLHLEIAGTCLRYMSLETFNDDFDPSDLYEKYPLLSYATKRLADHMEGDTQIALEALTLAFLGDKQKLRPATCSTYSSTSVMNRIHYAAVENLHHALALLQIAPEELEDTNDEGETPLAMAAGLGRTAVITVLIDRGASLNSCNRGGATPLAYAVKEGHDEVVRILVNAGALVDLPDKQGRTPLIKAAELGHSECVKILLDSGAATNHVDHYGQTPLSWAGRAGFRATAKILLDRGAVTDVM